jgi:hypothetical protein
VTGSGSAATIPSTFEVPAALCSHGRKKTAREKERRPIALDLEPQKRGIGLPTDSCFGIGQGLSGHMMRTLKDR